jgi:hypothetical protein
VLLITNGQLLATLSAARSQNAATIGSSHSLTETVLVVAATVVGLECSFHNFMLVLFRLQHQFGRQRYNIYLREEGCESVFFIEKWFFYCFLALNGIFFVPLHAKILFIHP